MGGFRPFAKDGTVKTKRNVIFLNNKDNYAKPYQNYTD